MSIGEHNTEQEDNYWAQRVQDKEAGELQERTRWVAAVKDVKMWLSEFNMPEWEDAGANALNELLTRMEAS